MVVVSGKMSMKKNRKKIQTGNLIRLFHLKQYNHGLYWLLIHVYLSTVELQWLRHPRNHENMFETGLVQANEC